MKQSNNKKNRDKTAFLYVRLSRDDNLEGDSYSIQNQKKLLSKIAKEKGYTNLIAFSDDGVSGVTMNRPGFNEMLAELEIRLVAVSDNLDSDEGESELTPIKNLFNEWYARDISKKRRMSNKIKGASG